MAWVVRLALKDWIISEALFGDSMIALCWLTSDKLKLLLFHRNRVLQVRRGTDLENVYHVRSEFYPADCGTRPSKVKLSDVGPDSRWENGDAWMRLDLADAVKQGVLKPVSEIRVTKDIEKEFYEGIVFGDKEELLTMGNPAQLVNIVSETRVRKIQDRAEFSDYLLLPTKHSFPATVRIYGYVMCFIQNARRGRRFLGELLRSARLWFSAFSCDIVTSKARAVKILTCTDQDSSINTKTCVLNYFSIKKLTFNSMNTSRVFVLTDGYLNLALLYLFRKSSAEVKKFVGKKFLSKITHEVDGILLRKR